MHINLQLQQQQQQSRPKNRQNVARHIDPLMPSDVTLAEVLGFVEVLGENGFKIPISSGGDRSKFFRGSSEFLSLLASARILELVAKADNRLLLTNEGLAFLRADFPARMEMLRVELSKIEPFKSAMELITGSGSVNSYDVSKRLSEKYGLGDFEESKVRLVLIEWGLPAGLFEYDKNGEFRPKDR